MDKNEALKLENQLCFALYAGSKEMNSIYKPFLDELGLTYTQYITMLVLWEKPVIAFKELGNRLLLDSGTLTPLVKKLEAAGLLIRERDMRDERNVIITLTAEGMNLKEKAYPVPMKVFKSMGITLEELISLRESLNGLVKNLQDSKNGSKEL